jgi:hypothetical protein
MRYPLSDGSRNHRPFRHMTLRCLPLSVTRRGVPKTRTRRGLARPPRPRAGIIVSVNLIDPPVFNGSGALGDNGT